MREPNDEFVTPQWTSSSFTVPVPVNDDFQTHTFWNSSLTCGRA
jgi:hypothetical protein